MDPFATSSNIDHAIETLNHKSIRIFGLNGRKGDGKDTFGRLCTGVNPRLRLISFAKPLKQICSQALDIPIEHFESQSQKETPFKNPIAIDDSLKKIRELTGIGSLRPLGLIAKSPREILQFIGTDYIRSKEPDYWVNLAFRQMARTVEDLEDNCDGFVITDVRFDNEAIAVKKTNGLLIRLLRIERVVKENDQHVSESLNFKSDLVLAIRENDWTLAARVAQVLSDPHVDTKIRAFDWNRIKDIVEDNYFRESLPETLKYYST